MCTCMCTCMGMCTCMDMGMGMCKGMGMVSTVSRIVGPYSYPWGLLEPATGSVVCPTGITHALLASAELRAGRG